MGLFCSRALTERGPRAVPRSGSECAAPRCARGALRCSRHKGGCGTARRGAERATTSWLLAGPSPAAPDFPLRRCASRRPIFAPAGYRPRAIDALGLFVDACRGGGEQSRGRVCAGSDICGAEERKTHGRARSALRHLTRRDCLSATTAGSAASFAAGRAAEHHREPLAQRGAAASERRRIPGRGFVRSI
jgi:hypothetical protein